MNDTYRNHAERPSAGRSVASRLLSLVWLVAFAEGLAVGGAVLHRLVGPPHLPSPLPRWSDVLLALGAADVPTAALVYLFGMTAWAIWIWLAGTAALRLVVVAAEALTGGAAWLRGIRRVSDRITSPLVRRMVDGAVVATVVVNVVGRASPAAAAGPELPGAVVTVAAPEMTASLAAPSVATDQVSVLYTVREGDNLWRIAERHYGKGEEFARIVEANAGRQMSDGRTFTRSGVIQPGWVLRIPLPDGAKDETSQADQQDYVVQPGDTLGSIAARLFGDSQAWPALFEANRGRSALEDGRTLTDPNLIWPGLRLRAHHTTSDVRPEHAVASVLHEDGGSAGETSPAQGIEPTAPVVKPAAISDLNAATSLDAVETVDASETAEIAQPDSVDEPAIADVLAAAESTSGAGDGAFLPTLAEVLESEGAVDPIAPAEAGNPATFTEHLGNAEATEATRSTEATEAIVAAVAALAAVGGAAGLARRRPRRARRSLAEPPPETFGPLLTPYAPDRAADGEGAAGELDRVLFHRMGGADLEPVVLLTDAVRRLLRRGGVVGASVVTVSLGRSMTGLEAELTLRAGLAEQAALLRTAPLVGAQLGGTGTAMLADNDHVVLRLTEVRSLALATTGTAGGGHGNAHGALDGDAVPLLLPVGTRGAESRRAEGRHVVYANYGELGHVLLAGEPGAGADRLCAGLVMSLLARLSGGARDVRLLPVGPRHAFLPALLGLTHAAEPLDPGDSERLEALARDVRTQLVRRLQRGRDGEPELVLLFAEAADVCREGAPLVDLLAAVATDGPPQGVRVLAVTTRPATLEPDTLAHFASRFVLRTVDADDSIRLLDVPDAAGLEHDGDLFMRIAGQTFGCVRGFQPGEGRLEHLASLLGGTVGRPAADHGARHASDERRQASAIEPDDRDDRDEEVLSSRLEVPVVKAPLSEAPEDDERTVQPIVHNVQTALHTANGAAHIDALPSPPTEGALGEDLVEIRCFGGFEVRAGDRVLSAQDEAGPRRRSWEILAFLASQPSPLVSTDKLLLAIWPDAHPKKALKALSAALSRLRGVFEHQLPDFASEIVVRSRGGGTCALDTQHLRSDVQRFVELCHAAKRLPPQEAIAALEEAHALYRGDLLRDQSYVWIHEREGDGLTPQERYRETYRQITIELATLYRQAGRVAAAVPLCRGLLRAEPTVESVARELYRCYQELGDRVSLTREHRQLMRALQAELADPRDPANSLPAVEAQPETVAAYEGALAALGGPSRGVSQPSESVRNDADVAEELEARAA